MGLEPGELTVIEGVDIDLSTDRFLSTPPFTDWIESQMSRERLTEIIESLRGQVASQIAPRAMYRVTQTEDSGIQEYNPPDPLLESSHMCCLLVTVGETEYGDASFSMAEKMVRDAMENATVGFLKQEIALRIRDDAHETGWNTTRLFSPGSGNVDWDITNSAFIFEILPGSEIGMSLSDSGLILPPKSGSSVIGLGPDIEQAENLFSCEGCPRIQECDYAVPATNP